MERATNTHALGYGNVFGNVTISYNNIAVNKTDDEDNQIKQWLSPQEPQYRHESVRANRVDGVGNWLLERKEFREWSGTLEAPKQAVLLCYGDPGVGKTHISSLVIDWLCDNRDIPVTGLYCDYRAREEQSAMNMLGAILKQLLHRDGVPGHVREAFRKGKRGFGGRTLQLLDLVEMLKKTIASLPEVFICIDGLDECLPSNRQELLESLQDIVRASPNTRVFLSGRPHIRDEIKRCFTDAITIPVIPTVEDIKRYLKMILDRDATPSAMDENLRAEIMRVVPETISKVFLLVSLNIDSVLEEVTIHQRKQKLDQMIQGNGLEDAYSATLVRIKAQRGSKSRLGMEMLMWLSHSEEPLNADDLCHALGVEIGSTDLNSQNIPAIETLLGCSLGLVILEASSHTIRLVHYTLKEYLFNNTDLFHSPHSVIAQVCLTYLNFQCVRDLSPIPARSTLETPLLKYASCHWGTHARREMTESVNTLALRLLDRFDKHVSSGILLSHNGDNWDSTLRRCNPKGFTGLHGMAYLGILELAAALLEMRKWDLNTTDVSGNTAISWAARKGHGAMVKMLLEREDVTPDIANNDGQTPLLSAVRNGHEEVVKILLEQEDISPDSAGKDDRTPLSWGARTGHGAVVRTLLKRGDVAPDTADKDGRTPLSWASRNGHGAFVKMFLEREDVIPDTADNDGRTPLSWAADFGNEDAVKMLLEQVDVSPDIADKGGRTPLSWAAGNGRGGVVKTLLEREDVTPDTADIDGRTPLSWAADFGNEDVVKMLLERDDITPDTTDEDCRTPLSWAAGNGRGGVVKMLLEREDVTPDIVDKSGRTPLTWAAKKGHGDVVMALLEREDFTPDVADRAGRTPLLWAAKKGHGDIARALLRREDVAPDIADKAGRTPLLCAAKKGHGGIVKALLEREDVTPDIADKAGRTPLLWAAKKGHGDIARALLEREDVTPDIADKAGRTPLLWAAKKGHGDIARVLLRREDVTPDIADKAGRTPLLCAAKNGHGDIIKALLEREDITLDTADKDVRTPLSWAAEKGHGGIVKMLFGREDITPDIADKGGRTPLSWAAGNGNEDVVKMLLERENVTPDTADEDGRTPLSLAVAGGHRRVVETLLARCGVSQDIVMTDLPSPTPFPLISEKQHQRVLKRRLENQASAPESEGGDCSIGLSPADISEPSGRPSTRIRRF